MPRSYVDMTEFERKLAEQRQREHQDKVAGAVRYAQADKSDPFTFARCMAHIKSGICDDKLLPNGSLVVCRYDADPTIEKEAYTLNGEVHVYDVRRFKNMRRP